MASLNTSLTILGPSPKYFCTNSDPTTRIKEAVVWWATALANMVFPQPIKRELTNYVERHRMEKCRNGVNSIVYVLFEPKLGV